MLRWLNVLGAQPFAACITSSPVEATALYASSNAENIPHRTWPHMRVQALDDARVPLLNSSNV